MHEAERLSSLISDICDAALLPSLWVDVLANCARFVGGPAAALFSRDTAQPRRSVAFYSGIDARHKRLIVEKYIRLDPLMMARVFARIGEPVAVTDVTPRSKLVRERAYQEWAHPQGFIDVLNVALDKSATGGALLCVFRHERDGSVDDEMRLRMRLIVPHVRRAVLVGRMMALQTSEAAAFADTLDGLSAGMFLVDARGRIVHANAAGRALLVGGSMLRAVGGKLAADDAGSEKALHEVFLAAANGDAAIGIKGVDVPLIKRDGERYVAHVCP